LIGGKYGHSSGVTGTFTTPNYLKLYDAGTEYVQWDVYPAAEKKDSYFRLPVRTSASVLTNKLQQNYIDVSEYNYIKINMSTDGMTDNVVIAITDSSNVSTTNTVTVTETKSNYLLDVSSLSSGYISISHFNSAITSTFIHKVYLTV